ncbi:MAG: hypothetical protein PWQ20_275 [Thermotogaceae bacterium]|nr:hypothetical protein [Thermotogaceae bacterium]MDN5337205.1 hypothetical protein [Thermotogaceae bacterium]
MNDLNIKESIKATIEDYVFVTIGSLITAIALDLFLIPNQIIAGGVSGLATIIYYMLKLPVGLQMLGYNVILFILGFKLLGLHFGFKSIYSAIILSVFVDFFSFIVKLPVPDLSSESLLAPIYGGALAGLGMGIVFWRGASTGGTDIIALIINRYTNISNGTALMIIDTLITVFAIFIFGPIKAMYGILTIFVTSKIIDSVLEGVESTRSVMIISEKIDEIKKMILDDLERGATIINATGAYTNTKRPVLWAVVRRRELAVLRRHIHKIDPKAFIVILKNSEVFGEGFKKIS